ncbi:LysR family transcriptional regulator [uncultured Shewanella sp.]|uniref:LysR family transcriptional regulator n=1 Tax=uncultured Shewanella sp. TaxID=173975 RepID=UPI002608C871|nr:LysR family transcriptional regulator [uncultured Shewanella sp.]
MNSLHLKALLLATRGSISSAARQLGKKQPQVSQWISDLEIELGVELFERTGNRTSLSQAGRQLLPHLIHTLSQLEQFEKSAELLAKQEPIVLRIGIENYIPDLAFTQPLAVTLDLAQISVEVYRADLSQLQQDLTLGSVDIIIAHESDILHHTDFQYCRLGYYQEVLVCSPAHPLAKLPVISTADLGEYRELVWGEAQQNESSLLDHMPGFSARYSLFSDVQPLIAMLKHSKGFAFLPAELVDAEIINGQLLTLECDFETMTIDRRIELCWRNGLTFSQYGRQVIDAFKVNHQLVNKSV